ncbi:MAG TPA: TVP38/TMEM64 family protein, partial [archaeon]|nr:TVP38/TMEM64 family protein [archaeon]
MIRMEESASADEENQTFSKKLKKYLKNLTDFSQYSAKTILYIIIFVVIIIASLILLYIIFFVDETFLYRFVIEFFVNPVYNLGILGILLFVLIMGVQGLVAPLPSEIVLLATGMIWGIFWGGLMGVIGSMAAALLCYYISRGGGRPLAEKFVGANAIKLADDFINKYGIGAIIIARFLPFIAFDPISYASGLVNMDVKKYSLG